jgi:peroxiredoxin
MFNRLHKAVASLVHTVTLCALFAGCAGSSKGGEARRNSDALQQILQTSAPSLSGPYQRLADFRGKIVMLHFVSSWCGQCGLEAPSIRNIQTSFKDSGFSVVGVAVDDDPIQMQVFASKYSLNFPVLMDTTGDFKTFFGIKELPATLFLDRRGMPIRFQDPESGQVTAKIEGARMWDTTGPVEMIARLVESR